MMRKKIGKKFSIILPEDLLVRVNEQAKKEGRLRNQFIRRVLDRYLREVELRGELDPAARESIRKNKELLRMLRNA
jgi:metal-responsive CopG/Arc/MetJ family transcriptional regulator